MTRGKHVEDLAVQLAQDARRLREQAEMLPRGKLRDEVLRQARQADAVSHQQQGGLARA